MNLKNETSALSEKFEAQEDTDLQELRIASQQWTPKQWESYLKTLESPLLESQIPPKKFDHLAETAEFSPFDFAQRPANPATSARVQEALKVLTTRQRQVVELIFFKSLSSRRTALELGISQASVTFYKRKALRKLRRALEGGPLTLPLVEGQQKKNEKPNA